MHRQSCICRPYITDTGETAFLIDILAIIQQQKEFARETNTQSQASIRGGLPPRRAFSLEEATAVDPLCEGGGLIPKAELMNLLATETSRTGRIELYNRFPTARGFYVTKIIKKINIEYTLPSMASSALSPLKSTNRLLLKAGFN
jgi:hypothetical protein